MKNLRQLSKTSEPQFLTHDHEFTFLGMILQLISEGIILYQRLYIEDLCKITHRTSLLVEEPRKENRNISKEMFLYLLTPTFLNIENG